MGVLGLPMPKGMLLVRLWFGVAGAFDPTPVGLSFNIMRLVLFHFTTECQ